MFWLRNKKNNFQLRTIFWGPAPLVEGCKTDGLGHNHNFMLKNFVSLDLCRYIPMGESSKFPNPELLKLKFQNLRFVYEMLTSYN